MRTIRIILPSSYRVTTTHQRLQRCPHYRVLHTVAWSSFLYAHRHPNRDWLEEITYQIQIVRNRLDDLGSVEMLLAQRFTQALWNAYKTAVIRRNYPDASIVDVSYTSTGIRVTAFEWDDSDKPF